MKKPTKLTLKHLLVLTLIISLVKNTNSQIPIRLSIDSSLSSDELTHESWRNIGRWKSNESYLFINKKNIVLTRNYTNGFMITPQSHVNKVNLEKDLFFYDDTLQYGFKHFFTESGSPIYNDRQLISINQSDSTIYFDNFSTSKEIVFLRCAFLQDVSFSEGGFLSYSINNSFFKKNVIIRDNNSSIVRFHENLISQDLLITSKKIIGSLTYPIIFNNTIGEGCNIFCDTASRISLHANIIKGPLYFEAQEYMDYAVFERNEFNNVFFTGSALPDTLVFKDCKISGVIDLTGFKYSTKKKKCILIINNTDLAKFKFDFERFKVEPVLFENEFTPAKPMALESGLALYEMILRNLKENGQPKSYQQIDIQYQRYKGSADGFLARLGSKISDLWWQFGYKKERIFFWTILFLIIFCIISYKHLESLNKTYKVFKLPRNIRTGLYYKSLPKETILRYKLITKETIEANKRLNTITRIYYIFIFNSIIFFQLRLDIDRLLFSRKELSIYILLLHTVGLFCLLFIANFIFKS